MLYIIIFFTLEALHRFTKLRTALGSSTFYAISRQRVSTSMDLWKKALPSVKPFYAVKCNPDPNVIRWLATAGAGFDCASVNEVRIVKSVNRDADIVFANPCKSGDEIVEKVEAGIQTTVIDSTEELDKLKRYGWSDASQTKGPSASQTRQALVRIRVEDKGSLMRFSAKFGLEPEELPALARYAKAGGHRLSGISFHVGSGCKDPQQFKVAIEQAYAGIKTLTEAGHYATTIDIGGGFMSGPLFQQTANAIQPLLHNIQGIHKSIQFIGEPGRFFAASSHDLFVRVIGKKSAGKGLAGWRYTLDESLYGQFSCIPFDHARPRWIRVRGPGEARRRPTPAVLYGRTCDSLDFIAASASAEELEEGDWLWFPHMGAYTTATSTEFNGFPKPPSVVLEDTKEEALPDPEAFPEEDWPTGLKYVSAAEVPS
jgi:ornithine decarboxylase